MLSQRLVNKGYATGKFDNETNEISKYSERFDKSPFKNKLVLSSNQDGAVSIAYFWRVTAMSRFVVLTKCILIWLNGRTALNIS